MAATALQGLGDLYESVDPALTPALPQLWTADLPEGTARTFPNAELVHKGTVPTYQKGKGKGGNTGIKYETTKATFKLWYAGEVSSDPEKNGFTAADLASENLMAVLLPLALAVDGAAATVLRIDKKLIERDGSRGVQGQFIFRADVDVTAQVDF